MNTSVRGRCRTGFSHWKFHAQFLGGRGRVNRLRLPSAPTRRHDIVTSYGATPIEGRSTSLNIGVHAVRTEGVDAAFDGVGGVHTAQCVSSTRPGGITVWYGFVGARGLPALARSALALFAGARLRGRRGSFYGITMLYRKHPQPFHEDLPKLLNLLAQRRISPRIAQMFPLLDARKANEQLEAGGIDGKLVLVAFEKSPGAKSLQATAAGPGS